MSIRNIHLDKLLKAFFLERTKLISLLRGDIRNERSKERGENSVGGNFYTPFWSDAKNHMRGSADLRAETTVRIDKNKGRERLYELLESGFLNWWEDKRRWTNLEFEVEEFSTKGKYEFSKLGATVKVENLIGFSIGEDQKRLIYPYFYEEPAFSDSMSRLGLWLMSEALPDHDPKDMRILDIHRSNSNSIDENPLRGTEKKEFAFHYERVIRLWDELRVQY